MYVTHHYSVCISEAKQGVMLHKYGQSEEKSKKCEFLKSLESLDLSYWQHSGSSFSEQFRADRENTRSWWSHRTFIVNCNLQLAGKMTCKKAPLFS